MSCRHIGMGLEEKLREAESQACLDAILDLASILPGRLQGVEDLILRRRMGALGEAEGSPRPAGGGDFGVKSGSRQASGHSTSGDSPVDVDLESIARLATALLHLTARVKHETPQVHTLLPHNK